MDTYCSAHLQDWPNTSLFPVAWTLPSLAHTVLYLCGHRGVHHRLRIHNVFLCVCFITKLG